MRSEESAFVFASNPHLLLALFLSVKTRANPCFCLCLCL